MAEKGKISEDKLVDSSIYEIGQKIAKSLKEGTVAVNDINKDLLAFAQNLESIKKYGLEFSKLEKVYKKADGRKEFLETRRREAQLTEQNTVAYKEQQRLETNLIKTIERKTLATESTNKSLIKNRFELQQLNKIEKENAILTSKTATAMQKASVKRSQAIRTIQDLNVKKELGIKLSNKEQRELRQSERAFLKYDKAIKVAKKSTGQFQENVGNYPKLLGGAISGFKTLIPLIGAGLGLREAWNFTKESLQLAREAKGVEFAFQRIGAEGQIAFDKVRISARGLLSDLEIKKAIVDFDNFNLSLDEMNTLMEFAVVRSTQTGKSVDYMLDSLKEGLSKGSLLRLDNLGVSMVDMRKQMDDFGLSVVEAFSKVAGEEVKEAGKILDKAADSQQKFNVELENFQISAGSGFIKRFTDDVYGAGAAFISTMSDINEASDSAWDFFTNIGLSVNGYSGLVKAKAAVNKEERKRLKFSKEIESLQKKLGFSEEKIAGNKIYNLKTESTELLKTIDILKKKLNIEKPTKLTEEELAKIKKRNKQLADDEYKISQYRILEAIKTKEEIIKNEDFLGLEKIRAIQEKEALEIQLAEDKEEHLLKNQNLTADARTLIEEQTANKIGEIYTKTFAEIDKVKAEMLKNATDNPLEEVSLESDADNDIKILEDGIKSYAEALGLDGEAAVKQFADEHGNQFEKIREFYEKIDKTAKESAELRKELEKDLTNASIEFVNTLFDAKIVGIENEINANTDKYDNLYSLAEGDADQQERIRNEEEVNRKKLEKKKREEQRKQAIFNKAIKIAEITFNTSTAILGALAQVPKFDFGVSAGLLATAYGAIGALELATVIATPIPAYAKGIESTPRAEKALVGEERPEVIQEPNKAPYIVSKPTILDLPKGTKVTPSVEEYQRLMRASNLASLDINHKKATSYQESKNSFNDVYVKELIKETKELKQITKRKNLSVTNNIKSTDFNHELFRIKNTNWES